MKISNYVVLTAILLVCQATQAQTVPTCSRNPEYLTQKKFDLTRTAFSTQDRFKPGLLIVEFESINNISDNAPKTQEYQHPSWTTAGTLGPFARDERGNIYVFPVPKVNEDSNNGKDRNTIYIVDTKTEIMSPFIKLPVSQKPSINNPYGLLSIYFDCFDKSLFASSVSGSSMQAEYGIIYHINPVTKKIISTYKNLDATGLCISNIKGDRRLFFGHTRNSDVFSLKIDENGNFVGKPQFEFSLEGLGQRGDDVAYKIRPLDNGLLITGIEFYYNLTAPSELQQNQYEFRYDNVTKKWIFANWK